MPSALEIARALPKDTPDRMRRSPGRRSWPPERVEKLKRLYDSGVELSALAERFGLPTSSAVTRILKRKMGSRTARAPHTEWTPERKELARVMWERGDPTAAIVKACAAPSRHSILGAAYRNGWSRPQAQRRKKYKGVTDN